MAKVNSLNDLIRLKETIVSKKAEMGTDDDVVLIKVGMATCGIASGAKEIMKFIVEECEQQAIDVRVMQTGCIGYCYAEPVIEVQIPSKPSKIFGFVDKSKAREIVEKYIIKGESVEGEIAVTFDTI